MPKVTVYIPSHNYGKYLGRAIQSVLKQTMSDWELIVIDDGSTDDTAAALAPFRKNPRIRIIEQENKGLNFTNNIALRLSNGDYLMRLDADDYLDENILLVLSNILDTMPEVGLVYPDYYEVDEEERLLQVVRRKKIDEEVDLLDLPAHGACTMIRKGVLLNLGGYYDEFNRQDGYGLWLKFVQQYHPYNVNIPLFYYRQHAGSLSRDESLLLETRRRIKSKFVDESNVQLPKVMAVVPVVENSTIALGNPFTELAARPLLSYTLDQLKRTKRVEKVVVSSASEKVLEFTARYEGFLPISRPVELTKSTSPVEDTLIHALDTVEREHSFRPDAVCVCYINSPFRKAEHIDKAVDTMAIFKVDSVLAIQEELALCYHHERNGLEPINGSLQRRLRLEREAIFKEAGGLVIARVRNLRAGSLLGTRVGHITMLPEEGLRIRSEFDFWLAEKIAMERGILQR